MATVSLAPPVYLHPMPGRESPKDGDGVSSAFELALKQLSVAQLKRLAFAYQKDTSECETKVDYVGLLSATMNQADKLESLRTALLAGRGSMALFRLNGSGDPALAPDFDTATALPSIVTVGAHGAIIGGLRYVAWAVLDGQNTFLDARLNLKNEPEAVVINSFYDPTLQLLQVRGAFGVASRIARRFAGLIGDETSVATPIGFDSLDEVHRFVDQIKGSVAKCHGDKLESGGFLKMTGSRHPNLEDLRGTRDYEEFTSQTEATGTDIEFRYNDCTVSIGIALKTKTVVFRSLADESVLQFVYENMKQFFGYVQ